MTSRPATAPSTPNPHVPGALAPDAATRDALKRAEHATEEHLIRGEDITFVTRHLSGEERAAVLAVLSQLRSEETDRVRLVRRREREPWARSQRTPEGIGDLVGG